MNGITSWRPAPYGCGTRDARAAAAASGVPRGHLQAEGKVNFQYLSFASQKADFLPSWTVAAIAYIFNHTK